MPLGDVSYQDAALDAVVASWPSSGAEYALFVGDPLAGGTELTSTGGYARVAFAPADLDAAADGAKAWAAPIDFGTSTGAWSDVATHFAIIDGSDLFVYTDDLPDEIAVDETGTAVTATPAALFFQEEV